MVDEIDQRILGVLTDSGREMTVSEVMDELMAIYGEPYRRCRIRNRLQTLVKFRYCTSREATESIRGKPTRFYGIWRRERMTNPCEIGFDCPHKRYSEKGDPLCGYLCKVIVPEMIWRVEDLACPLVGIDTDLEYYLSCHARFKGRVACVRRIRPRRESE